MQFNEAKFNKPSFFQKVGEDSIKKEIPKTESKEGMSRRKFLEIILISVLGTTAARFYFPKVLSGTPLEYETEKKIETDDFEKVKQETISQLAENSSLKEEIGQANIDKLIEIISRINTKEIKKDIAQWVNISQESLKEEIQSLSILSKEQWEEAEISATDGVLLPGNKMFIKSSTLLEEGSVDEIRLKHVFFHEYFHVLTGDSNLQKGRNTPWIDKYEVAEDFYEGATELMTLFYLRRKDINSKEYGYKLGNTLTAFYFSRLVEENNFAKDYFAKSVENIAEIFDKKFGQDQFNRIITRKKNRFLSVILGGTDDLDILYELSKLLERHSIDYEKIHQNAKEFGITEEIAFMKSEKGEIEGLISSIDQGEGKLAVNGVLVTEKIMPHGIPYRIYLGGRGVLPSDQEIAKSIRVIKDFIRQIKDLRKYWKSSKENRKKFPNFEEFLSSISECYYYKPINITQLIAGELENYRAEEDINKKKKIKAKIYQIIEQTGKEVVAKILKKL